MSIRLSGGGAGGGGSAPLVYYSDADNFSVFGATGTHVYVAGIVLEYSLTFSNITLKVMDADAVNDSDCGMYNMAGALIANIGAQALGSVAVVTIPTLQGIQTIPPGLYLFAFTSAGSVLGLAGDFDAPTWFIDPDVAASIGGALPAAIGLRTVVPSYGRLSFQLS